MYFSRRSMYGIALIVLLGCARTSPGSLPTEGGGIGQQVAPVKKTITLATLEPVTALGPWDTSAKGGVGPTQEIHTSGLVTSSVSGAPEARLTQEAKASLERLSKRSGSR